MQIVSRESAESPSRTLARSPRDLPKTCLEDLGSWQSRSRSALLSLGSVTSIGHWAIEIRQSEPASGVEARAERSKTSSRARACAESLLPGRDPARNFMLMRRADCTTLIGARIAAAFPTIVLRTSVCRANSYPPANDGGAKSRVRERSAPIVSPGSAADDRQADCCRVHYSRVDAPDVRNAAEKQAWITRSDRTRRRRAARRAEAFSLTSQLILITSTLASGS